ncbi:LLM class flavin-dependent oxidoreductase [Streptomyces glaucus]|uniref:LLM class flavin-dependent oxidoreductase n=1 Tax=Streptomyces glaucus TaxID=284029 RepID=A0ABP5WW90_9ACTN
MTSSPGRALLHLAAAVGRRPAHDAGSPVEPVRLAERGALDFVTLDDGCARPGPDALTALARAASATHRVGLVPTVPLTHTGPCHVRAAAAALDRIGRGRAGWRIEASATEDEARLLDPGGGPARAPGREADEDTGAAAGPRDGREDGARVRDAAAGRDEPDHVGSAFPAEDFSTAPRPSRGRPVRVADATEEPARRVAARYADVALVRAVSLAHADSVRAGLRADAARSGRDPDGLRILASLVVDLGGGEHAAEPGHGGGGPRPTPRGPLYRGGPVDLAELIADWHRRGVVDGFHIVPAEPHRDLERLVNGTVALLQHRGLFRTFYPGGTLRDHLGLARPADRCVVTGGTS